MRVEDASGNTPFVSLEHLSVPSEHYLQKLPVWLAIFAPFPGNDTFSTNGFQADETWIFSNSQFRHGERKIKILDDKTRRLYTCELLSQVKYAPVIVPNNNPSLLLKEDSREYQIKIWRSSIYQNPNENSPQLKISVFYNKNLNSLKIRERGFLKNISLQEKAEELFFSFGSTASAKKETEKIMSKDQALFTLEIITIIMESLRE